MSEEFVWPGFCPICDRATVFRSENSQFRDYLLCDNCPTGSSIPRERAVILVQPPEYHGNPIDGEGSFVTYKYGYDFPELLAKWAPFNVEFIRFCDRYHGIVGEFTDVMVCHKMPA